MDTFQDRANYYHLLILLVFLLPSCGGSQDSSPVESQLSSPQVIGDSGNQVSNRITWGIWDVVFSDDHLSAEVKYDNSAAMHLNVVRWLEQVACSDCLKIENISVVDTHVVQVDFVVTHPLTSNLKFTGFDLRGIFISDADYTFPSSGRFIAWGEENPRLLHPDGYTHLFNPTDFPIDGSAPPLLRRPAPPGDARGRDRPQSPARSPAVTPDR